MIFERALMYIPMFYLLRDGYNPFPLILNPPKPPILNPPNIVPICNKGEVSLLGGGGVSIRGKGLDLPGTAVAMQPQSHVRGHSHWETSGSASVQPAWNLKGGPSKEDRNLRQGAPFFRMSNFKECRSS